MSPGDRSRTSVVTSTSPHLLARSLGTSLSSDAHLAILVTEHGFTATLSGRPHSGLELLDAIRESEPDLYSIAMLAWRNGFRRSDVRGRGFVAIVTDLHRPSNRVRSMIRVRCPEEVVEALLDSCLKVGDRIRAFAEHTIASGRPFGEGGRAA